MIERPIISRQTDRCISISNRYQRVVRLRFFISHFFSEVFAFCDFTVFYFRPYRYIPIYFLLYFQFRSVDCLGWFWWIGGNFRYILLSAMTRQHAPMSHQLTGHELFSRHPRSAISSPRWKRDQTRAIIDGRFHRGFLVGRIAQI